jgi:hypothetical protein
MDLFLNLWNILKNSLIYIFVRYLSYSLLKIHRKLTSGYFLGDKATLRKDRWLCFEIELFFCFKVKKIFFFTVCRPKSLIQSELLYASACSKDSTALKSANICQVVTACKQAKANDQCGSSTLFISDGGRFPSSYDCSHLLQRTRRLNSTSSRSSSRSPSKSRTRSSPAVDGCSRKSSPSSSPVSTPPSRRRRPRPSPRLLLRCWGPRLRARAAATVVTTTEEPTTGQRAREVSWSAVSLGTARLRWFCRSWTTRVLEEKEKTTSEVGT